MGVPVGLFVVAITFLELFVAALQAYIFTLLSSLFIGLALEEHEHHEEAHAAHQ
jgi:F-type H+-transporting ATPase subunit a